MTVRQFVVVVLVFAAGFAMASIRIAQENASSRAARLLRAGQGGAHIQLSQPEEAEYSTHRVVVDGQGRDLGTCPRDDRAGSVEGGTGRRPGCALRDPQTV